MNSSRRLAAIMCTDISGYTSLMQENEESAMELLVRHRRILEEYTRQAGGEVLQYFGDGSLSIYPSALNAVRCAMHIQQTLQEPPVVPLRIGLHVGDIVQRHRSIFGDGVNLAFRIQSIGLPGAILFSQSVYDAIRNHPELSVVSLGKFCFKHVDEPMETFALAVDSLVVPCRKDVRESLSSPRSFWGVFVTLGLLLWLGLSMGIANHHLSGPAVPGKKTIAVLPFEYLADDTAWGHLCALLHEEIIHDLSDLTDWQVISRTTAGRYQVRQSGIREIGRETGANVVLEGGVSVREQELRITVRLIDAIDDRVLWSETFENFPDTVLIASEAIVHAICGQLPPVEPEVSL